MPATANANLEDPEFLNDRTSQAPDRRADLLAVTIILMSTANATVAGGNWIEPSQKKYVSDGDYCVHSDDFGSSTWLYNNGEQGFRVVRSTANGSRVTAYPDIFRGWQWGIGTNGDLADQGVRR
jgi:hypothetical protein